MCITLSTPTSVTELASPFYLLTMAVGSEDDTCLQRVMIRKIARTTWRTSISPSRYRFLFPSRPRPSRMRDDVQRAVETNGSQDLVLDRRSLFLGACEIICLASSLLLFVGTYVMFGL